MILIYWFIVWGICMLSLMILRIWFQLKPDNFLRRMLGRWNWFINLTTWLVWFIGGWGLWILVHLITFFLTGWVIWQETHLPGLTFVIMLLMLGLLAEGYKQKRRTMKEDNFSEKELSDLIVDFLVKKEI